MHVLKHTAFKAHVKTNSCLQLHGYLGGVHLAVLTAFICLAHPDASLTALVVHFFQTFAFWPWPKPVMVLGVFPILPDITKTLSFMPIQLPSSPNKFCHSNVTRSTFYRIKTEFLRGCNMTWVCFFLNNITLAYTCHHTLLLCQ